MSLPTYIKTGTPQLPSLVDYLVLMKLNGYTELLFLKIYKLAILPKKLSLLLLNHSILCNKFLERMILLMCGC
jgi:hypothetical protein